MRPKCILYVVLSFWALGINSILAQSSVTLEGKVRHSLFLLAMGQTADAPISSPRQGQVSQLLELLGPPIEILLSTPVVAQGLNNFSGRIIHQKGTSEWTLGALDTGKIVTYAFILSTITPPKWSDSNITDYINRPVSLPHYEPPPAPPVFDPRVVEFLFATNRQEILVGPPAQVIGYSGERGPLTYGAASVRIPDDPHHKMGRIELPASWRVFGLLNLPSTPDEHRHFVIKRMVSLSEAAFDQLAREKASRTALVFVHGFNTTFEDALYRNAQIVWDLQYEGLSVLFTWPSRGGNIMDYWYDKDSAYLARAEFIKLLTKLKRDYNIDQVNVIAHSMGNLIALDSLANHAQTSNPVQIARLIMAAPDVDRNNFEALAPMAKAIVGGMTLYVSSADRALNLSKRFAGGIPRAGDVPVQGPIVISGVETIDVTAVGEDILGLNHNVFAASREVIEDISAILRLNRPPPRLSQIRPVPEPPNATRYWRYVR